MVESATAGRIGYGNRSSAWTGLQNKEYHVQLHILAERPKAPMGLDADPGFGKCFTPGMILADYTPEQGWHNARLVDKAPIPMDPACVALHYAQSIFEGMKAFRDVDGDMVLFRVADHAERLRQSAERMAIPPLPDADFVHLAREFVAHQGSALSDTPGHSLYLRPLIFGSDPVLGVHPSKTYTFVLLGMIASSYFAKNAGGLKIWVEEQYVRAVHGGTGSAKTAGNYAASLLAQRKAQEAGASQVLWLDANEHRFVEELGGMNFMAVIDGTLTTPPLGDTILSGITRRSILALARHQGLTVAERPIEVAELLEGIRSGKTTEAFACGTAATISRIDEFVYRGESFKLPTVSDADSVAGRLKTQLQAIQVGAGPDEMHWLTKAHPGKALSAGA
jgi:branched-chain amino acid aminotransferase